MNAGWYYQANEGRLRFWDGQAWTDLYRNLDEPAAEPASDLAVKRPPAPPTHARRRRRYRIPLPAALGLAALFGTGGMFLSGALHRNEGPTSLGVAGVSAASNGPAVMSRTGAVEVPTEVSHSPGASTAEPNSAPATSSSATFLPAPIATAQPQPPVITGTITVMKWSGDTRGDGSPAAPPDDCSPGGGYEDIRKGAQVILYDEAQSVIGSGSLLRGYLVDTKRSYVPAQAGLSGGFVNNGYCQFTFALTAVRSASFYGVEVSHRGPVIYPAEQLKRSGNRVAFTLG